MTPLPRLIALAAAATLTIAAADPQPQTLIHGARVFDGTGKPAKVQDVLIRGDRIVKVGKRIRVKDATVVEAGGLTLIPGLHDLHIHTGSEAFASAEAITAAYRPYLASGITSVNEYSVSGEMMAGIRALKADVPHIALAQRLGVPGGHGTESAFTSGITLQVTNPAEAHAAMAKALPYKPDVIKVFADGWRYGDPNRPDRPSMDEPTLAAIVEDAHRAHIPVVTHTVTLAGDKIAAEAGVDSVVHGVGDAVVDDELIALMKRHKMAYVSTLAVYEPQETRQLLPEEWKLLDATAQARENFRRSRGPEGVPDYDARRWAFLQENIRRLKAAHIPIGVGTDTGIGGVYPGFAAIREMRILVQLGFTPAEALAAGTSVSAKIMHQERDHGTIKRGMRADLVLIGGKPDQDILDIYKVRRVWVSGKDVTATALAAPPVPVATQ